MGTYDDRDLQRTLGEMLARAANKEKPLNEIGFLMDQAMKTNIAVGGRPDKWKPSIRVQNKGGQTLRDTGELMNSITHQVDGDTVASGAGSSVSYKARILALGGVIKAKTKPFLRFRIPGGGWVSKKEVTIPARHFEYVPPETTATFGDIVLHHLMEQ